MTMTPEMSNAGGTIRVFALSGRQDLQLEDAFETRVYTWDSTGSIEFLPADGAIGFVFKGPAKLCGPGGEFTLQSGMFFSLPNGWSISGGSGFAVSSKGEPPFFLLGGPIENTGRLRYIDGCRDSLLISPVVRGAACLNALYFPSDVDQTMHTHPSVRIGLVINGSGACKTGDGSRLPLMPGDFFVLPPNTVHGFLSAETGMTVIAYHPDSDTGPADEDHPMINRTIIDGVSAAQVPAIHTQG